MNSRIGMLYPFGLDCKQLLDKERWEESSGQKQQHQIRYSNRERQFGIIRPSVGVNLKWEKRHTNGDGSR